MGPWSIGGGGNYSTSYSDIRNASSGTTVRIEDTSKQLYVVAVVSLRQSDLLEKPFLIFADEIAKEKRDFERENEAWEAKSRSGHNDHGVVPEPFQSS